MVALKYAIPQGAVRRLFGDWVARDAVRRFNCRWLNPIMLRMGRARASVYRSSRVAQQPVTAVSTERRAPRPPHRCEVDNNVLFENGVVAEGWGTEDAAVDRCADRWPYGWRRSTRAGLPQVVRRTAQTWPPHRRLGNPANPQATPVSHVYPALPGDPEPEQGFGFLPRRVTGTGHGNGPAGPALYPVSA
jgi:hypothetical protein